MLNTFEESTWGRDTSAIDWSLHSLPAQATPRKGKPRRETPLLRMAATLQARSPCWAKDFFAAGPGWVPPDTRDEVIDYIGTWTARAEVPVSGRAPPTRRATASSNVDTARSRTNASATRLLGTSRKRGVSWLTSSLTTTKSGSVAPSATSRRSTSSRDETPRS